jgi:hypothetical protein
VKWAKIVMAVYHRHLIRLIRGDHSYAVSVKRLDIREIGALGGLNSFVFELMALWCLLCLSNGDMFGWVASSLGKYVIPESRVL